MISRKGGTRAAWAVWAGQPCVSTGAQLHLALEQSHAAETCPAGSRRSFRAVRRPPLFLPFYKGASLRFSAEFMGVVCSLPGIIVIVGLVSSASLFVYRKSGRCESGFFSLAGAKSATHWDNPDPGLRTSASHSGLPGYLHCLPLCAPAGFSLLWTGRLFDIFRPIRRSAYGQAAPVASQQPKSFA